MKIGLRIFLGYFLIVGLAAFLILRVFVNEVKPGVRQAMEDTLVDTANILAELAADDLKSGHIADGAFAHRIHDYQTRHVTANISGFEKSSVDYRVYVTDAHGVVVFDSESRAVGRDYSRWNDVYLTLQGRYGARTTRETPDDPGTAVMHVAAPIRDGDRIIGVLSVAKSNSTLDPFIKHSQRAITQWGWLLLATSLSIGLAVTIWLSRALNQLTRYAHAVAAGERAEPPRTGNNEITVLGNALETMRQRLEGKQYVEHYIHSLTHEMKSPLAAIRGAAELLGEPMSEADRERFSQNIQGQVQRLSEMIEKMLALAGLEHRQSVSNLSDIDIEALLSNLRQELEPRLQKADVTLRIRKCEAPVSCRADEFLVRQALFNLLENAIDFSPRGGEIELQAIVDAQTLHISVTDQGPGIPEFAINRVFERFYSLPRPDGGSRSTGLGLCIVREIAQLHRGEVSFSKRQPTGASFVLSIPLNL